MKILFWIYCVVFSVVSVVLLSLTNRESDPWPGVTAVGCFGIAFLWPLFMPIAIIGYLMGCVRKVLCLFLR